jgi:putative toxin-antitoxin system antitoxin component (TIGR02293 family)
MANRKEKHGGRGPAAPRAEGGAAHFNVPGSGEGKDAMLLIRMVREGLHYPLFERFSAEAPFSAAEWAVYLHLSERTIQRYKKEQSAFEPPQAERILEIMLLFDQGEKVFGHKEKFNTWLNAQSVALGNMKPKDLLDSSFGISLLKDELIKIEHGVLA